MFVCPFIHTLSLHSSCAGLAATLNPSARQVVTQMQMGKMRHRGGLHLWALVLMGLVRTRACLWPKRLELFHKETELSHLTVDETLGTWWGGVVLYFSPINLTSSFYAWIPEMLFSLLCVRNGIIRRKL